VDAPTDQAESPTPAQHPADGSADSPPPDAPSGRPGADLLTIGLLVFFVALIGVVAALLLLPLLNG
jgi:hypothetical protein